MIHLSHPHQGFQGMSLHVIKQCLLENLAEMIIIPICLLQNEKICVRFMKIYGQSHKLLVKTKISKNLT